MLVYAGTGLALIRLAVKESAGEARAASRQALWRLLQLLGYKKWLAEMLARSLVTFISGASRGMSFFVGVNLCVSALPDNWSMNLPAYMQQEAASRGLLHAAAVELLLFKWSQRALVAFMTSLFGYCLLQLKQAPQTPVPESEGLKHSDDRWGFLSVACLMYAKQNPQDKRVRYLAQRVALPERVVDFVAVFGIVFLPWTYLFGFKLQTVLAVGGVGGLAAGLAAQNLVENLISGVLITLNRPFSEGDEIEAEAHNLQGIVDDVGFTVTRINRMDGVRIHVPNSRLLGGVIVNRTMKDFRMVNDTVPVVASDLRGLRTLVERVQAVLDSHPAVLQAREIAVLKERHSGKLKLFPPVCAFTGYGPLGAKLYIQAYMRGGLSNPDFLTAKSDLMLQVNNCVLDNGLSVGFGCFTHVPQFQQDGAQGLLSVDRPPP